MTTEPALDHRTRLEESRNVPEPLKKLLAWDVSITKRFVSFLLNFVALRSLKTHCRVLEVRTYPGTPSSSELTHSFHLPDFVPWRSLVHWLVRLLLCVWHERNRRDLRKHFPGISPGCCLRGLS